MGFFHSEVSPPEETVPLPTLAQNSLAIARVIIGASAAFILFLFFESGALSSLFAFQLDDPLAAFMLAFVAGFSERLLVKSLESSFGEDVLIDQEYPRRNLNEEYQRRLDEEYEEYQRLLNENNTTNLEGDSDR